MDRSMKWGKIFDATYFITGGYAMAIFFPPSASISNIGHVTLAAFGFFFGITLYQFLSLLIGSTDD